MARSMVAASGSVEQKSTPGSAPVTTEPASAAAVVCVVVVGTTAVPSTPVADVGVPAAAVVAGRAAVVNAAVVAPVELLCGALDPHPLTNAPVTRTAAHICRIRITSSSK